MKLKAIFLSLVLGVTAFAGQDAFHIERKYVLNDADKFLMKMQLDSMMGQIDLTMDIKETVKKLYDNGDADIESAVSNMVVNVQGQVQKVPAQAPTTIRYDKYGMPAAGTKDSKGMSFMRFGNVLGDKAIKVGETVTFDRADEKDPKTHAKGTVKLESLDAGVAKLIMSVDQYSSASEKPMHIDGTSWIEATGKLKKLEGKVTGMPAAAGGASSATFVLERK